MHAALAPSVVCAGRVRAVARRALLGAWLVLGIAACTSTPPAVPGRPVEVARGVYMVPGERGEVAPENGGRLGNTGFIVGPDGVIAVDAGVSYRHGQALLAEIARVTDKPVKLVILTHTRQEFLFGGLAFRERGIPIHMHRKAAMLMAARCETCLKMLNRVLGEEAMRGTAMFKPDVVFDDEQLVLGAIGRPVRVLHLGHSSGPGDVVVLDESTRTLFAGGLVDDRWIPEVFDGDLKGWKAALARLEALQPARIVPGHGPLAGREAIPNVQRYLTRLETRLIELLNAGAPLSEVPDLAALPEYRDWDQYDTTHRRNASVIFVRLERELLFK